MLTLLGKALAPLSGVLLAVGAMTWASPSSAQQTRPPGYAEAETAFLTAYDVEQRLRLQVLMTAAGYWNAVATDRFSERLFRATQKFQAEQGFAPNGQLGRAQLDRLIEVAAPKLALWGFRKVSHPTRRVAIWMPLGLGLRAERNEFGLRYADPQGRARIDFTTVPNVLVQRNYPALLGALAGDGARIHYKVQKDDWFVISASTPDGLDHYVRYHQDGPNVTGFTLSWNNANGDVGGDRLAVLMSASLWALMTGSPTTDPPVPEPRVASRPPAAAPAALPPSTPEPAPRPVPPSAAPRSEGKVSSGTGFFVASDGSFVTNAHVIEDCSLVRVKTDDGAVHEAKIVARDAVNDLALLKLPKVPGKVASLRVGARLGEGVAAFGFPHADLLSSSGNFTLGNVTALSGIKDDSRQLQVSAPVQSGNSGGPLLDTSGHVVGVVTSKLNALKLAQNGGDLPQNVNFAVKAAILATFLDANRVTYVTDAPAKALDPADIADGARAISGFVACR